MEKLSKETLAIMLNKEWVHLGESMLYNSNNKVLEKVDYSKTTFKNFYWKKGDKLSFQDTSVSFIYSEHFFEHLFLDEAIDLFNECYRILENGGVLRIVVPDADLRTIPERVGFPDNSLPNNHPRKHKTRWSYYSLEPILSSSGFEVIPITYFDKFGKQHVSTLKNHFSKYSYSKNKALVESMVYIKRKNSLIIDGVKLIG